MKTTQKPIQITDFYRATREETGKYLEVDRANGLKTNEIPERQEKYGKNTLPEQKKKTVLAMIADQLNDWLIYILAVAVIVTGFMGEWVDACIIAVVIIINAVL